MIYKALQESIEGDVFTDSFRRHMFSTDDSIFRWLPVCVPCPKKQPAGPENVVD